jgi:oligopeptide/dipeptide ABC transporter ATP-binding protein
MKVLVRVEQLRKYFPVRSGLLYRVTGYVRAVDGVDLRIEEGQTLGLVGESGCGKSTLARTVLRLLDPDSGKITFDGLDITRLKGSELRKLRRHMQIVFQDPYTSLHPRMRVEEIVGEPLRVHYGFDEQEIKERVAAVLSEVGLGPEYLDRYPHELSGGQRQRVAIARAIALRPRFLVLDEPTSSLDVSVQAKILTLLKNLQSKHSLTYLFISHNIFVVEYISEYVGVMYLGKLVEYGPRDAIFKQALHPYTTALLSSVPIPNPKARNREKMLLKGEPPSPLNPPPGCRFHPRCPYATERCRKEEPSLVEAGRGHYVACHMWSV